MDTTTRIVLGSEFGPKPERGNGFTRALAQICGVLAGGAAVAIGAVLTVIAAVAVAVIALVAGVLVFLAGLAFRARRSAPAADGDDQVIEARKVGHAWVTYGWDGSNR
jgi:heme/copper-type cytochrome/quinol oxidase subunit 2